MVIQAWSQAVMTYTRSQGRIAVDLGKIVPYAISMDESFSNPTHLIGDPFSNTHAQALPRKLLAPVPAQTETGAR